MAQAELTELRLYAFKSVRKATIPINSLTLIVGRNGSGKSNVLDGLTVLSALAAGAIFATLSMADAADPSSEAAPKAARPLANHRSRSDAPLRMKGGVLP